MKRTPLLIILLLFTVTGNARHKETAEQKAERTR
jgi:hypothetical protein